MHGDWHVHLRRADADYAISERDAKRARRADADYATSERDAKRASAHVVVQMLWCTCCELAPEESAARRHGPKENSNPKRTMRPLNAMRRERGEPTQTLQTRCEESTARRRGQKKHQPNPLSGRVFIGRKPFFVLPYGKFWEYVSAHYGNLLGYSKVLIPRFECRCLFRQIPHAMRGELRNR